MSYDLYFTEPEISLDEFNQYFKGNDLYTIENGQAWYSNDETGVYFCFEYNSDDSSEEDDVNHSVSFNMNYFRPHYFALEAEPEVSKFIQHFKMSIYDYQNDGMENGPYSSEGFIKGWNHGNEFGYSAILNNPEMSNTPESLPTKTLENTWAWNYERDIIYNELQEDIFIPKIMFITLNNTVATCCVWPDGIPTFIPKVDHLLIPRQELAPKKFFKKTEDMCLLSLEEALPIISQYAYKHKRHEGYKLPTDETPKEIIKAIKKLSPYSHKIEGVPSDQVLNREIMEKQNHD